MASTARAIDNVASTVLQELSDNALEKAAQTEKPLEKMPVEKLPEPVATGEPVLTESQNKPPSEKVAAAVEIETAKKPLSTTEALHAEAPKSGPIKLLEGGLKGAGMAVATNPIDVGVNKLLLGGEKPKGILGHVKLVAEEPFKGLGTKMTGNILAWAFMTVAPGKIQKRTDKLIHHEKASETTSILLATVFENGLLMPLSLHLGIYQACKKQIGIKKTFFESVVDVNKAAYAQGGLPAAFKANYRGYIGTTGRSGLFFAPYVLAAEALKKRYKTTIDATPTNKNIGSVFCSAAASVLATTLSCPANVLTMRMRASLMEENRNKPRETYIEAIKAIYRESGLPGFSKGLAFGVLRIIPTGVALGLISVGIDRLVENTRHLDPRDSIPSGQEIFPWGSD
jgi:hypothetical protein